jgi:hypothetical protein
MKLPKATVKDLYDISMRSAQAKDKTLYIYEKSDLSKVIGEEKAEEIRQEFLKNKILVKQITNIPTLPPFSENDTFINTCMTFRYVPEELFSIKNEILIFDDCVAIYNIEPEIRLLVIEDKDYATNQRQLFTNLWDQGQSPLLGFDYQPNHSYFKNLDFKIDGKHVIVYPDKDAVGAYKGFDYDSLKKYIEDIIHKNNDYFKDSTYLIVFIWNYEGNKMVDIWKFDANFVDDRSGPLGEAKIFKEGVECHDLGLASGSTLMILGYEEKLRRQAGDINAYFQGPPPELPLEIINKQDFFEVLNEAKE